MGRRTCRGIAAAGLALAVVAGGTPAQAGPGDRTRTVVRKHEPREAGHPLRIVAYLVHPIGVVVDTLLFRPAHWIVSHEPMRTIFGHED